MDFVFVCPPSNKQTRFEKTVGLAYIQAYLKSKNISSVQFTSNSNKLNEIVEEIINLKPKIIGFSCYDANFYYVNLLSKKIKERLKDVVIVVGGPTATFSSDTILKNCPQIDYCSRGYGEIVNYNLFEALKNNKSPNNIKGISYRLNDEIINNPLQELPENLDDLPSPYLSEVDYDSDRKLVFTSRGCIYKCVYCNCSIMSNNRIKFFSVDRIIAELEYINKNYPNSYVQIGDDAFTLNIDRAKTICRKIIEKKFSIKLFCETRIDRLDDELLLLLKEAGFIKMDFGLESANLKVLKTIKKVRFKDDDDSNNYDEEIKFLEKMKHFIPKCKELNLDPMVNIISGLPTETVEQAKETLQFIKDLKINSYSHNYLRFYAGTELYRNYQKYGYELIRNSFILPVDVKHPIDLTEVMPLKNSVSRNDVVRLKNKIIKVFRNEIKSFKYEIVDCESEIKQLQDINLNEELFVFVKDENEVVKFIDFVVKNEIPTNNLVFIKESLDKYECFSILDRHNQIVIHKIVDDNFKMPTNYYELLLVAKLTDNLMEKFKKLNVNPRLNKTVLLLDDNFESSVKDIAIDYCKTYNKNFLPELLNVLEKLNFDVSKNILNNARMLLVKEEITRTDLQILNKFLYYYLMGSIDEE